jgi:homoserine O-succinyltransferase
MREFRLRVRESQSRGDAPPEFPEHLVTDRLINTWRDTARVVVGKWIGLVYQYTGVDRRRPFMDGVDSENPLGL